MASRSPSRARGAGGRPRRGRRTRRRFRRRARPRERPGVGQVLDRVPGAVEDRPDQVVEARVGPDEHVLLRALDRGHAHEQRPDSATTKRPGSRRKVTGRPSCSRSSRGAEPPPRRKPRGRTASRPAATGCRCRRRSPRSGGPGTARRRRGARRPRGGTRRGRGCPIRCAAECRRSRARPRGDRERPGRPPARSELGSGPPVIT